jgi:Tfp pilus assembly protein FimV
VTEETPETSRDEYDFPDKQFSTLYEQEQDTPLYDIAASEVYEGLRNEGFSTEAVEVSEYLSEGDVEAAEELTEELLEEGDGEL